MPIILDDIAATTSAPVGKDPKFFSSKLTGNGARATGLINDTVGPLKVPSGLSAGTDLAPVEKKYHHRTGDVTMTYIPMHPLRQRLLDRGQNVAIDIGSTEEMLDLGKLAMSNGDEVQVYVDITPQAAILREDETGSTKMRDLHVQYRLEVIGLQDQDTPRALVQGNLGPADDYAGGRARNVVHLAWTYHPAQVLPELVAETFRGQVQLDEDAMNEWLGQYDVYSRICRLADAWSGPEMGEVMNGYVVDLTASAGKGVNPPDIYLNELAYQLQYMETYGVPLEVYRGLHQVITDEFDPAVAKVLCKRNMNLLMSDELAGLQAIKDQLPVPAVPATPDAGIPAHFSKQQRNAITSTDPLTMVQAGAGTGKSSTIIGRLAYLPHCGVPVDQVGVWSFTNAAADNIKARNPGVVSMTIARTIHDIYTHNYPGHELSTIETILNSLEIFYGHDDMAHQFRRYLLGVKKNDNGSSTSLNTFIEMNFDAVIGMLDTIGQTCLELEIIICYQKIEDLAEPNHVQCKYLIVDEVQDNSIFEFIYTLRYVAKHKLNLFIVGDGSQTLYEFRSSNPKALNALESSGVFTTHKLTTNYRSNQEILDFANVALNNIEANQFAKIQLQANSLEEPTADSFTEKVTLNYKNFKRKSDFTGGFSRGGKKDGMLPGIMRHEVKEYIDACVARGEKVAFLAYTRSATTTMMETLADMYPGKVIADLRPQKTFSTTVFSDFIRNYWNDICQVAPFQASYAFVKELDRRLGNLSNMADTIRPMVNKMVQSWWMENAFLIDGTTQVPGSGGTGGWVAQEARGEITKAEFFDLLRQNLLDYEIRNNAIKQALMGQKNKERKEANLAQNPDFYVSTIHSAKGLEFDNVVVVHAYDPYLSEADKRMYYVAFTRAMKSEYILSYGTQAKAKIREDYDALVDALTERDRVNALCDQGLDEDGNPLPVGIETDETDETDEVEESDGVYDATQDEDAIAGASGMTTGEN